MFTTKLTGPAADYFRANWKRLGLFPFMTGPDSVEIDHQARVIIDRQDATVAWTTVVDGSPRDTFNRQLRAELARQEAEAAARRQVEDAVLADAIDGLVGVLAEVPFGD